MTNIDSVLSTPEALLNINDQEIIDDIDECAEEDINDEDELEQKDHNKSSWLPWVLYCTAAFAVGSIVYLILRQNALEKQVNGLNKPLERVNTALCNRGEEFEEKLLSFETELKQVNSRILLQNGLVGEISFLKQESFSRQNAFEEKYNALERRVDGLNTALYEDIDILYGITAFAVGSILYLLLRQDKALRELEKKHSELQLQLSLKWNHSDSVRVLSCNQEDLQRKIADLQGR